MYVYMQMHIHTYEYECVYICVRTGTHTQSCVHWKHKRPTSPCTAVFPMAFHVHCPMLCFEDGELPACGSQTRGQSLSHKEGQDYDDFEWQVGGIT